MQRKRDGLTPQPRPHFTRLDQVDQLIGASEADPDMGFMVRLMALCSLPRTNPGNREKYVRHNGPYTLIMSTTGEYKLPYGNLPRLLLAWVCTEAVRTQSRELNLGRSLSEFIRNLGVFGSDSGGSRGDRTRLRNQMTRLFTASVRMVYKDEHGEASVSSLVADRTEYWWNKPDNPSLWENKIRLGEEFFAEIIQHPVPLDMNILKALKRCSLGLDLYLWLNYRTFTIRSPLKFTWRQLCRTRRTRWCNEPPGDLSIAQQMSVFTFQRNQVGETDIAIRLVLHFTLAPYALQPYPLGVDSNRGISTNEHPAKGRQ